jgi:hypothetical protein
LRNYNEDNRTDWGLDEYGPLTYIGSGVYGVAYGDHAGRAVKLTRDETEFINAAELKGRNADGIVDIYDAKDVGGGNYVIVMQKVEPLTLYDRRLYCSVRAGMRQYEDPEEGWYDYRRYNSEMVEGRDLKARAEYNEVLRKYEILMDKLDKIGMGGDAHHQNVGIDPVTGEYVRFDLGTRGGG